MLKSTKQSPCFEQHPGGYVTENSFLILETSNPISVLVLCIAVFCNHACRNRVFSRLILLTPVFEYSSTKNVAGLLVWVL